MPTTVNDTEFVVRDFVRRAVMHLSEASSTQLRDWETDTYWERGADGHFRERKKRARTLWRIPKQYQSIIGYDHAARCLKADPLIGSHLDRLVGTEISARRLEADDILWAAIYAMLNDDGTFAFADEHFDRKWQELMDFCSAERLPIKTVVPVPNLGVATLPLQLNSELVIDRLTEDEVTRCCQVGVLRPVSPGFPIISSDVGVGIRKTIHVPKVFPTDDEQRTAPDTGTRARSAIA